MGCLVLSLALTAAAQDATLVLDLGGGVSVRRDMVQPRFGIGRVQRWSATGLALASEQMARGATWFARVRTGRIVAAVLPGPATAAWRTMWANGGIVYTDDLGRSWHPAEFDSPAIPTSIAFDPGSTYGVAVATGHIWSTDDGGGHWRDRRADDSNWVGVVVIGHACVLRADDGTVKWSRTGGFELTTLATDPNATAEMDGDSVVVQAGGHRWRLRANGDLQSL